MDVRAVVYRGVSEAFQVPVENIRDEMTPSEVESWDSLTQLQLVLEIERSFGIALEPEDAFRIVDIGSIIELVEEKLDGAAE